MVLSIWLVYFLLGVVVGIVLWETVGILENRSASPRSSTKSEPTVQLEPSEEAEAWARYRDALAKQATAIAPARIWVHKPDPKPTSAVCALCGREDFVGNLEVWENHMPEFGYPGKLAHADCLEDEGWQKQDCCGKWCTAKPDSAEPKATVKKTKCWLCSELGGKAEMVSKLIPVDSSSLNADSWRWFHPECAKKWDGAGEEVTA